MYSTALVNYVVIVHGRLLSPTQPFLGALRDDAKNGCEGDQEDWGWFHELCTPETKVNVGKSLELWLYCVNKGTGLLMKATMRRLSLWKSGFPIVFYLLVGATYSIVRLLQA